MDIKFEDMPCFDASAPDVDLGIQCGAFERFVANETLRFVPRATTRDGLLAERRQLVTRLHEEFIENGFCLLARFCLSEIVGTSSGNGEVDVSIYTNTTAGSYGECPHLIDRKQAKQN